jgi:endonuclease I
MTGMIRQRTRRWCVTLVLACGALSGPFNAIAQYEPPPDYYDSATGSGFLLRAQLHDIINNHVVRSYGTARFALQVLDRDPSDLSRVILIYNAASVPAPWDSGVTWNREHQWPRSRGVGSDGADTSDLFNLRPCNPGINSSRSNQPYGTNGGFWDPDALSPAPIHDRGDCARSMFYMAIRYTGTDANTENLSLTNGFPSFNQMGDLAKLLDWHYSDPVDDIELRRNHLIYSSADNPFYYQGNRNPFIDHPEFVWSLWGGQPNNSTIAVAEVPPAESGGEIDFTHRFILGEGFVPELMIAKTGQHPTTYNVIVDGDISSPIAGTGLAFAGGEQSTPLPILGFDPNVPGIAAGTITIDNTDITSAGPGMGADDPDDVINVSIELLLHSEGSLSPTESVSESNLEVAPVSAVLPSDDTVFQIYNLPSDAGPTADLNVSLIDESGDTDVLFATFANATNVPAGQSATGTIQFDNTAPVGTYQAIYVFSVQDEDIPGALPQPNLTLFVQGQVTAGPVFPFDNDGDGDLDLIDFTHFITCVTGPNGNAVGPVCVNNDQDMDNDVDLLDFSQLQILLAGSE